MENYSNQKEAGIIKVWDPSGKKVWVILFCNKHAEVTANQKGNTEWTTQVGRKTSSMVSWPNNYKKDLVHTFSVCYVVTCMC